MLGRMIVAIAALAMLSFIGSAAQSQNSSLDGAAKAGLQQVQLALERYHVDSDAYPLLLSELVPDYLPAMPENPYLPGERMKQVSPEHFYRGGMVYHPFSLGGDVIDHYFLGVFGAKKDGGKDLFLTDDRIYWVGDYRFYPERKLDGEPEGLIMVLDNLDEDALAKLKEHRKLIYQLPEDIVAELDARAKQFAHALQAQIERCGEDWGFGDDLDHVLQYGYDGGITELPQNPYYLVSDYAAPRMRAAKLEDAAPGDIVYYTFSTDGSELDRYILLVKGGRWNDGLDLFLGPRHWDDLYALFDPPVQPDGGGEGFVVALDNWDDSTRKLLREKPWLIKHNAAWLASQVNERAKEAAFQMQIAVERYSVDNDVYPPNLQTLIKEGYTYWPLNPYAEFDPSAPKRVMQVQPGEFTPGGIVYFPYEFPGYEGKGLSAYYIGIYGAAPNGGSDVGAMTPEGWRFYWFGKELPAPDGFAIERDGKPDGIIVLLDSGPVAVWEYRN